MCLDQVLNVQNMICLYTHTHTHRKKHTFHTYILTYQNCQVKSTKYSFSWFILKTPTNASTVTKMEPTDMSGSQTLPVPCKALHWTRRENSTSVFRRNGDQKRFTMLTSYLCAPSFFSLHSGFFTYICWANTYNSNYNKHDNK